MEYVFTLNEDEKWIVTWFEDSGSVYVWQNDHSERVYIGKATSGEEAATNGFAQILVLRSLSKNQS